MKEEDSVCCAYAVNCTGGATLVSSSRKRGVTMFEQVRKRKKKVGMAPGSLVYVGQERGSKPVSITVIRYGPETYARQDGVAPEECCVERHVDEVTWVNVDGVHDVSVIQAVGQRFGLHPLILEDITHTGQRPKFEDLEAYIYVVLKMLHYDEAADRVAEEQVSLALGPGYVLTFQEETGGDVFEGIRERLAANKGRGRKAGPDYLFYALLDAIVDNYFLVLERMGDEIEAIEETMLATPSPAALEKLHTVRREALFLRKYVWPLREVISKLLRGDLELIKHETSFYLRDLYDHTIQVMDTVETFRDMLAGMADLYLSNISLKLNESMKVLTIVSTVFIPPTLLAGIWGMNFKNIPELSWEYGYYCALGVMFVVGAGMLYAFRRKKWM